MSTLLKGDLGGTLQHSPRALMAILCAHKLSDLPSDGYGK